MVITEIQSQNSPDCDMALVHDNDLACIYGAVRLLFINQSYRLPHCSSPRIASNLNLMGR